MNITDSLSLIIHNNVLVIAKDLKTASSSLVVEANGITMRVWFVMSALY